MTISKWFLLKLNDFRVNHFWMVDGRAFIYDKLAKTANVFFK